MDKANEALKLWQEWFEENNKYIDAAVAYDELGNNRCFFCHEDDPIWNGHHADCIYIRAKTLVKGPLFEGLDLPR